jgi:hypothetical protein
MVILNHIIQEECGLLNVDNRYDNHAAGLSFTIYLVNCMLILTKLFDTE